MGASDDTSGPGRPPSEPAGDVAFDHPPREYRIDELARLAGTTVRNVRAYQDRGLLPAPRREGRVGWYGESHLGRLRLVAELLGRGYSLANIAELVAGWESGRDLSELLGLESALFAPWSEEAASSVSRDELIAFLGEDATAELLAEAEGHGLLRVEGDRARLDNPRMLEGAAVLVDAGVPVRDVLDLGIYLADAVDAIAARYVELIERHLFAGADGPPPDDQLPRVTALIRQLRPLAKQVLDAELALALERRIQASLGERLARGRHGADRAAG